MDSELKVGSEVDLGAGREMRAKLRLELTAVFG